MKWVKVRGARVHNLKNIDVDIPKGKLVVITGLSGSGKSSLAIDTIHAEGQRRYLESLSTYVRQFLGNLKKPDVDSIEGLSPAIAIDQRSVSHNPRSTVGTVTEIYDYLRILYAKIGVPHCPICGTPLQKMSVDEIVDDILEKFEEGERVYILSPVHVEKKGTFKKEFEEFEKKGFLRVEVDGEVYRIEEVPELDKNKRHTVKIVIDRLKVSKDSIHRLADSVELALRESGGFVEVRSFDRNLERFYSERLSCPIHRVGFPEINPKLFSFNSPYGACEHCHGLGFTMEVDPESVIDENLTLEEGAIIPYRWDSRLTRGVIRAVVRKFRFFPDGPFKDLPDKVKDFILNGDENFEGVLKKVGRWYRETESEDMKEWLERFIVRRVCPVCDGKRLRKESLSVRIYGLNIIEFTELPIERELDFIRKLKAKLSERESIIVGDVIEEIEKRLRFLVDVGLGYITLDRSVETLSGGEAQRIRLATQIGSGLTGVIYVLDEPTIGLHPRDTERLIDTLKKLRDLDNTVIVVEHDEDVIRSSDWIIDLGPGAGENGGHVVYQGSTQRFIENPPEDSMTGKYLKGTVKIEVPRRRTDDLGRIVIKGVKHNNLKNITVEFPIGKFIVVTGVSGSGKSSLVMDTLYPALRNVLTGSKLETGEFDSIEGVEKIRRVISIDQSPIGRTPRSTPATYTKVFDEIRELFSMLPESRARGYTKSRFSFNLKGGRCEACQGQGYIKIEMLFMPDVYIECDVCKGRRYNRETLEVKYKGKNIADVLDMTVDEALEFFKNIPKIKKVLQILHDVGLGYIRLGQPATTLSGGEAQRVKLASELRKTGTVGTVYILDEPTVGLHMDDVKKLIDVLHRLVDRGNTVIVIEHNLDVIKSADWVIDLGPEGGEKGGYVVVVGTPEDVARCERSYTGKFLRRVLR